ncbi:MAG: sigma-70 family RNA polymerase sigma factor [Pirellulaceae bacterium]|nr:sigma-70 family RNA polymerase sigma factor [Pirellulaceae bacterium]
MQRLRDNDETAWPRLVNIYGPLVYRWSRAAGLQPDDAGDVVQDVFGAVHACLPSFRRDRQSDSFRGWLWSISRNKKDRRSLIRQNSSTFACLTKVSRSRSPYTLTQRRRIQIRDFYRRRRDRANAAGGTANHLEMNRIPEQPADESTSAGRDEVNLLRRQALEEIREQFEPQTWTAFWRVAVEGDAAADVAADLNVTVWAVYKARTRVLQRLRDELQDLIE